MFSYEIYKVMHLVSIFAFLGAMGASFYAPNRPKLVKVLGGISSFLILVGGMGLLARIGGGFEPWVIGKLVIWALLAIGAPMMAKRFSSLKNVGFITMLVLAGIAVWFAVNKPF